MNIREILRKIAIWVDPVPGALAASVRDSSKPWRSHLFFLMISSFKKWRKDGIFKYSQYSQNLFLYGYDTSISND